MNVIEITKEFACEHKPITINSLIRNQSSYDFNPPYQRNKVWSLAAKIRLIETIISNNTINSLHICPKDDDYDLFFGIDGKQRFTTIIDFANGDFTVTFRSLKNKTYPYIKQQAALGNKDAQLFVQRFEDFQIYVVRYQRMLNLSEQVEIFKRINYASDLKPNEKLFGQHYYVKSLCQYILENGLVSQRLLKRMKGGLKDNNRFEWTRLLYEILITISNVNLRGEFAPIDLTENKLSKYLEETTKSILSVMGGVEVPIFSDDELIKIGIYDKLKKLEKCIAYVERLIYTDDMCQHEYKSIIPSYSKPYLLHFILFLYDGFDRNIFTDSFLDYHHEEFLTIWQIWCDKEFRNLPNMRDASKDRTGTSVKLHYLWELVQQFNLDDGKKNNKTPDKIQEQIKLYIESHPGLQDPETRELISAQNLSIDHITPKSLASRSDYAPRSRFGNLAKSNSPAVSKEQS
jgi:hypothetical protein